MHDTCVVQRWSATRDSIGDEVDTYTDQTAISGGVKFVNMTAQERFTGEQTVPQIDVLIRLPAGTVIDTRDRIKITRRYGVALATPWIFSVLGEAQPGPAATVVNGRWV